MYAANNTYLYNRILIEISVLSCNFNIFSYIRRVRLPWAAKAAFDYTCQIIQRSIECKRMAFKKPLLAWESDT